MKPIMIAGTSSDAGKSIINAGLCRIFRQDGLQPAPFKAQNMSLNSYATPEGFEIGRAQAVQAEACGIPCHTDMNPVLLKPTGDLQSQVILNGKPIGNRSAKDYFQSQSQKPLFDAAFEAFERLSRKFSPIVMEGAGSIAELNLKHRDIVNMPMAVRAGASVILVCDIERGGVFASLYGSVMLLEPHERQHIKGFIINKFRGDISLFDEGRRIIEEKTGIPVLGVIPWYNHIQIDDEDSVALMKKCRKANPESPVNICVIALPYLSNFTDFNALQRIDGVNLYFSADNAEVEKADIIILPGSKNTIGDLQFLHQSGLSQVVTNHYRHKNKTVVGICGGYQMMGNVVKDPYVIEGVENQCKGLGLLPVETVIETEKTTCQVSFRFRDSDESCMGYEIHMGQSLIGDASPVNVTACGQSEGAWLNERCWGTYMHGIFDNVAPVRSLLRAYPVSVDQLINNHHFKEQQYDLLANHLRQHLDMDVIYKILEQ
jgi:adenosylcobyric acid synthase